MVLITQLIYIKEGAASVFDQFEAIAIPLISKYNGQLLLRLRPRAQDIIEASIPGPYEVHMVEFKGESDFHDFMKDVERKKLLHLKEKSIQSVVLYKGEKIS
jgi:hypothetical protein